MQKSENTKKTKGTYTGFTFKQRLLPVLLLAFAISLTVFVFGPIEIYGSNIEQFGFSLTDFLGWSLLYAIGAAGIICAILLPLRGRVFDIFYALFFWLGLMLMIQGNYLNSGITSLTGDGTSTDGFATSKVVLNTVIWCVVGIACVVAILLIRAKYREIIRTVGIIAMITVIGMQAITFTVTSLTSDIWTAKKSEELPHLLTYKNLNSVSETHNVIWFVIDRFDVAYYEEDALNDCPEIFYNLDGFTYYNDMVSLYPRTYPSVPYMLTGIEHDFHDSRVDYLEEAYSNSDFLKTLKENNYNVNIYTDSYYGYEDARHMEEYVSNSSSVDSVDVVNAPILAADMTRLSLYRYLPVATKRVVGDLSTPQFQKYVHYNTDVPVFTTDMKNAYDFLTENPLQTVEGKNNFSFIHIAGCHLPNVYNQDFTPVTDEEKDSLSSAMIQSFKIINLYLDQLKEMGLYENATIIITGDHGSADANTPLSRTPIPAFFIKESGSSKTDLRVSSAPVIQADIIPTIIFSEGIQTNLNFGRSVFDIAENEHRVRYFKFDDWQHDANNQRNDELVSFEIVGTARNLNNWKIVSRGDYIGYYLD